MKKIKFNLEIILVFIVFFVFFLLIQTVNASEETTLKNATRAYFPAKATKSGDCILLENYDKNGNVIYGLIDTGYKTPAVVEYLKEHNIHNLKFLLVTHWHKDHTGNLADVIDYIYKGEKYENDETVTAGKIDVIYMKDADSTRSPINNDSYYATIELVIKYNIKVVGMSYTSIKSSIISPRMYQENDGDDNEENDKDFICYKDIANGAKKENFEEFNYNNRKFKFGSADIILWNWQTFDKNGNVMRLDEDKDNIADVEIIKEIKNTSPKQYERYPLTKANYDREVVSNENNNSIGLSLIQKNNQNNNTKKAFFGGDMNNLDKIGGDEDRIKASIGDVDFMKANHHGFEYSNTEDFLNTLNPEYMIITNKIGRGTKTLKDYIKDNNVKYLYSPADTNGVSATITSDNVYLGFETPKEIKDIDGTLYYLPEDYIKYESYDDYLYKIIYEENTAEVSSWSELKTAIENNRIELTNCLKNETAINHNQKTIELPKLVLNLKGTNWIAGETIKISKNQNIVLNSNKKIVIYRGKKNEEELTDSLFSLNGFLSIGRNITLDGNKAEITANSALITIEDGTLDLYGTLQNNINSNSQINFDEHRCVSLGSGISCIRAGTVNMYEGSKIINNSQKVNSRFDIVEKNYKKTYSFTTYGAGIYLADGSELNMNGGEISGNTADNESIVTCKNQQYKKSIRQYCFGAGIYARVNSTVNLLGGKLSNNSIENNAKVKIYEPDGSAETNNDISYIHSYACMIYGTGIATEDSTLNISNNFEVSNNTSKFGNKILLEDSPNAYYEAMPRVAIRGGQIYCSSSEVKIDDTTIKDCQKATKNEPYYASKIRDRIKYDDWGGAICLTSSSSFDFNNLTITNCQTNYRGGAIFIGSCSGKILNSKFQNNYANEGGAIFNSSGTVKLEDVQIVNNNAEGYGGGLYNNGTATLINPIINSNTANTSGGGICVGKGKVIVDGSNATITSNIAEKSGGGILNGKNGTFIISGGKIQNNTVEGTNGNGGGICISEGGIWYKKSGVTISNNVVIDGDQAGKNIYPSDNSLTDSQKPTIVQIDIPLEYAKRTTPISINVNDNIGIKSVRITLVDTGGSKLLTGEEFYNFVAKRNGTYKVKVLDFFDNSTEQTFNIDKIVQPGDANLDEVIDIKDIFIINKYRLGKMNFDEKAIIAADLNDDGEINTYEIFRINKYRLGKLKKL